MSGHLYKPGYNDRKGNRHYSKTWHAKFYVNARPVYESMHTTDYTETKRYLKMREGECARGAPIIKGQQSVKFEELAPDMVNDYEVNKKVTLRDLKSRLESHINPMFGKRRASCQRDAGAAGRDIARRGGVETGIPRHSNS
jgi:hypothetical protein